MLNLDDIDFNKGGGTVVVVAQDARSGAVLTVAHADREALEHTLASGSMHYRSRTRGLWKKGATSGNTQRLVSLSADCDGDAVLALVIPAGPACHAGAASCFGPAALQADVMSELDAVIEARAQSGEPERQTSYTRRLLADRNLRLKKLGEETAELVAACADGDAGQATQEAADLLYHVLVALRSLDVPYAAVRDTLAQRAGTRTDP